MSKFCYPSLTGWNTLYFLWGVFRGKKAHCLQDVSASPKKYSTARYPPTATISLPESQCPLDGDLPTCPKACNLALASRCPGPALMESPVLSTQTTKVGFDINASSLDLKDQHTQVNAGQDYRFDATSLPRIQTTNAVSFQETRLTSTPLVMKFFSNSLCLLIFVLSISCLFYIFVLWIRSFVTNQHPVIVLLNCDDNWNCMQILLFSEY